MKIDFERTRDGMTLRDSLSLTPDEAASLTDQQIEAMKDARFEAWLLAIQTAPEETE